MKNKVIVSMLAITLAAGISIGTTNASMSVTHTSIENPVSNASAPLVTEISLEETAAAEEAARTAVKEAAETAVEEAAVEKAGKEAADKKEAEKKAAMKKAAEKKAAAKKAEKEAWNAIKVTDNVEHA
jgi:phosphate:Na+ symporter